MDVKMRKKFVLRSHMIFFFNVYVGIAGSRVGPRMS